jgi:signal transduction histidine kinase
MKQVIFDRSPQLNRKEKRIADLHSVFNILSVLSGELSLIGSLLKGEKAASFALLEDAIFVITKEIRESDTSDGALVKVRESEKEVVGRIRALIDGLADELILREVRDSLSNIESVYRIVHKRLDELEARAKDPDVWISIRAREFERQFREVFYAIEKNAKGRYRIFFNLARKTRDDYYIDLKIESALDADRLWIPMRLIDVLRDLTANARKYTVPGGKVALAIYQSKEAIQVLVEDSGCGIPEDEIERVVEFGYRASNVRDRPTMGGGFGLTKAAWLVNHWGGQLSIRSGLNEGTSVRFTVPNQPCGENRESVHNYVI